MISLVSNAPGVEHTVVTARPHILLHQLAGPHLPGLVFDILGTQAKALRWRLSHMVNGKST